MNKSADFSTVQHHIKTETAKDIDSVLCNIKGEPYRLYREEFDKIKNSNFCPDRPLQLQLESVTHCNQNCIMCYRNYVPKRPNEEISLDIVKKLAKESADLKIPSVWLSYGTEFTLHPKCAEIIRVFGDIAPLDFWLGTNGTRLSDEIIEAIFSSGITKMTISLDAATDNTYRKIRRGTTELSTVEHNIFRLLDKRGSDILPQIRLTFCEQQENAHERESFIEKWSSLVDRVDIQTYIHMSTINMPDDEVPETYAGYGYCSYPCSHFVVEATGDVHLCCYSGPNRNLVFGNVKEKSISEIWRSDEAYRLREQLKNGQYNIDCLKCMYAYKVACPK